MILNSLVKVISKKWRKWQDNLAYRNQIQSIYLSKLLWVKDHNTEII